MLARCLGVDDVDSPDLTLARTRFAEWRTTHPSLAVVDDLLELFEWTLAADHDAKDEVLAALVSVGQIEPCAITTVTWLLLPGATRLAQSLVSELGASRGLGYEEIDTLVASQLWIAASTLPPHRRTKVAAAILGNTRDSVLADIGAGEHGRRRDRAWTLATVVDPTEASETAAVMSIDGDVSAAQELLAFLTDAESAGVITTDDRRLLIDVAVEVDEQTLCGASSSAAAGGATSRCGLTTVAVAAAVGFRWSVSEGTVRRRVGRHLDDLSEFSRQVSASARTGGALSTVSA